MALTPRELDRLARAAEGAIYRDLRAALERIRAHLPLSAIERHLVERNLPAAIDAIGLVEITNALYASGDRTATVRDAAFQAEAADLPARFQRTILRLTLGAWGAGNPGVVANLAARQDLRIQGMLVETASAIRTHLLRGIRDGVPPKVMARQLRDVIGLTTRQEQALANFRVRLGAEDRPDDQVDRMVARKAAQYQRQRAESIARTESMAALEEGRRVQRERLVREGIVNPGDWEKEWVTADDERVCPQCGPLHGVRVGLVEPFQTEDGAIPGPPRHPNCRCVTRQVLRGFRTEDRGSPRRREILDTLRR